MFGDSGQAEGELVDRIGAQSEILFALFDKTVLRFSELERAVENITQKVLTQQLRELERDGMVERTVHAAVPPRVEYRLTASGRAICPALDALLQWVQLRRDALASGRDG
jgi:DNA-binding HxlR family transcriptional regulator